MARLRDAKPKNTSGSYERIFGNPELGALASKIQSAVITSGSELEAMIVAAVPNIPDLDPFLEQEIMPEGVFLATKRQIKKSGTLDFAGSEPDFMVFKRRKKIQACHIVELKDGHVFDAKKAGAERTLCIGLLSGMLSTFSTGSNRISSPSIRTTEPRFGRGSRRGSP